MNILKRSTAVILVCAALLSCVCGCSGGASASPYADVEVSFSGTKQSDDDSQYNAYLKPKNEWEYLDKKYLGDPEVYVPSPNSIKGFNHDLSNSNDEQDVYELTDVNDDSPCPAYRLLLEALGFERQSFSKDNVLMDCYYKNDKLIMMLAFSKAGGHGGCIIYSVGSDSSSSSSAPVTSKNMTDQSDAEVSFPGEYSKYNSYIKKVSSWDYVDGKYLFNNDSLVPAPTCIYGVKKNYSLSDNENVAYSFDSSDYNVAIAYTMLLKYLDFDISENKSDGDNTLLYVVSENGVKKMYLGVGRSGLLMINAG